jgi:hypothetical protein
MFIQHPIIPTAERILKKVLEQCELKSYLKSRGDTEASRRKEMEEPICVCGHVRDEHDGNICIIEGCSCAHFETEEMVDEGRSSAGATRKR